MIIDYLQAFVHTVQFFFKFLPTLVLELVYIVYLTTCYIAGKELGRLECISPIIVLKCHLEVDEYGNVTRE